MSQQNTMNNTQKTLLAFPDKPWNWGRLSRNGSITPEFITNNLDKPWDWEGLSSNIMKESDLRAKKRKKAKRKKEIISFMNCRNKLKMCDDIVRYTTEYL